jgi:CubicO group peptidase (beta-lactamase class C family)
VSALWPAFASGGKAALTVADVLRHKGGLEGAMPRRARLRTLLDSEAMEHRAAAAPFDAAGAASGDFGGAPWGWTLCGLLRAAGHPDASALLARRVCELP